MPSLSPSIGLHGSKRSDTIPPKKSEKTAPCRQRKGELLGGLWELPELDEMETTAEKIGEVTHEYSHFKLVAELYESNNRNLPGTLVTYENLTTIPTSSLEKKIFEKLKLL